jgi:hypothetical protein
LQQFAEDAGELLALRRAEGMEGPVKELGHGVFSLGEESPAGIGDGDGVRAAVCDVSLTAYVICLFEAVTDADHHCAVDTQLVTQNALRAGADLSQHLEHQMLTDAEPERAGLGIRSPGSGS